MWIRLYRYFDGIAKEIVNGLIDLDYPPKITQSKAVAGEQMSEEVRQYVELLLKNDLIPGRRGLEGTLEYYKPPVKGPIIQIDGVHYAWTIEETPIEADLEEIEESPNGRSSVKKGNIVGVKRNKILVVEDDPDFAKALEVRLKTAGYEVATAFDALQGISQVHKQKPDLIILDIFMPGGWGFTVAQKLKHSDSVWLKSIPMIFITGSQDEKHEKMAMRLGARFYFRKPISHEAVLDAVKTILENKR